MPRLIDSAPVNPQQDRGGQEEDQVQVERVVDPKPYHLFERRPALGNLTKRGKQVAAARGKPRRNRPLTVQIPSAAMEMENEGAL